MKVDLFITKSEKTAIEAKLEKDSERKKKKNLHRNLNARNVKVWHFFFSANMAIISAVTHLIL